MSRGLNLLELFNAVLDDAGGGLFCRGVVVLESVRLGDVDGVLILFLRWTAIVCVVDYVVDGEMQSVRYV